jgi:hypothetical protein
MEVANRLRHRQEVHGRGDGEQVRATGESEQPRQASKQASEQASKQASERASKQASKQASKRARLAALKPVYARARETLESTQHSHRPLRLHLHLQRNALLQDGDFLPKFRELGIPYDEIPPWMLELHTGAPLTW